MELASIYRYVHLQAKSFQYKVASFVPGQKSREPSSTDQKKTGGKNTNRREKITYFTRKT